MESNARHLHSYSGIDLEWEGIKFKSLCKCLDVIEFAGKRVGQLLGEGEALFVALRWQLIFCLLPRFKPLTKILSPIVLHFLVFSWSLLLPKHSSQQNLLATLRHGH